MCSEGYSSCPVHVVGEWHFRQTIHILLTPLMYTVVCGSSYVFKYVCSCVTPYVDLVLYPLSLLVYKDICMSVTVCSNYYHLY